MKYLSFGTKKHVSRFAQEMSYLLGDSYDQHMALAQGTGAARFIHPDDYCQGYDSQAALDADMPAIAFRRALGYQIDIETGAEFAKTDPFHQGEFLPCGTAQKPWPYQRSVSLFGGLVRPFP